jgi:predicted nucleic acid-binding protein
LTKLVVDEPESEPLRVWMLGKVLVSSALAETELRRAVRIQSPDRLARAIDILAEIRLVGLRQTILRRAGMLDPPQLRSLDAIHVASALALGDALDVFVTYDGRQAEAARAAGVPVESPA